jgi:hypothetical protein
MIFGSFTYFLGFIYSFLEFWKSKIISGLWAGFWPKATARCGLVAQCGSWTPRRGGPSGGLARPSRWPNGAKRAARARALRGAITVAKGGAVLRVARAHRRLPCGVVGGMGTRTVREVRRARRMVARLTEEVGRRWGGGERSARCHSDGGGWLTMAGGDPMLSL